MDLGLSGRVALIAGGSAGIGAATARLLGSQGARVVLLARSADKLEETVKTITAAGGEAQSHVCDILDTAAVDRVVASIVKAYGRIDIAVLSIGAAQGGEFFGLADSVWSDALELKLMGSIRLLRAVVPHMQQQRYGRVAVVVGNNGRQPVARMLPGSAANAALLAVVKGLADEVAPFGVTINAINPGPTQTGRWEKLMDGLAAGNGQTRDDVESEFMSRLPLGKPNQPEDIAGLIAMLVSDVAKMMTGTSLTVDGGATKAIA